jgi:glycosyltransferase involved in cell wall biosynthesis
VISTVLNERANLPDWLASLVSQERLPDELVIVDAGSIDGTVELLRTWALDAPFPVMVLTIRGCTRSEGRNRAISNAAHDLIAVTDAGCRLDPAWLSKLGECLKDPEVDVAAGWFRPWIETPFDRRAALLAIPALDEIAPETFLPSSRSLAFRRSAWSRVGGYPEPLNYAEDTRFDLDLRAAGACFRFVPEAIVYWRPAASLKGLLRMARNYGLGDGLARIPFAHRRAWLRYVAAPALLVTALFLRAHALVIVLLILGGVLLFRRNRIFQRRAHAVSREGGRVSLLDRGYCLFVDILVDLARTWGFLQGTRQHRSERRRPS